VVDLGEAPLAIGHLSQRAAGAGRQVTVRGSGFDASVMATVGSEPASVSITDENTLTLTAPAVASGPEHSHHPRDVLANRVGSGAFCRIWDWSSGSQSNLRLQIQFEGMPDAIASADCTEQAAKLPHVEKEARKDDVDVGSVIPNTTREPAVWGCFPRHVLDYFDSSIHYSVGPRFLTCAKN
jgi:hypothetical protein